MKRPFLYCLLLCCYYTQAQSVKDVTRYVNPFIGTGFHGHVFLGANVPFGAVQLGPVNLSEGWDWCSGYHYSDSTITGFSHTHLSGTGIGDLGDISLMPVVGNVPLSKGSLNNPGAGYYSLFSHDRETARPGYYAVHLKRYNIDVALTATERVGMHQYSFPASDSAGVIIDLANGIGWDEPVETFITKLNDTTLMGYRFSKGWAADQRIYFSIVFSRPFKTLLLYDNDVQKKGDLLKAGKVKAMAYFAMEESEKIFVKVGISPVSSENALSNIKAELPHWDFNAIVAAATGKWEKELGKLKVESRDTSRLINFYTALYHTLIAPSLFNDHNGDYRGTDKKIYTKQPFTNYTTFSLWDTYRAAHPLFTLYQQKRVNDMVNSMLAIYKQQGKLPIWHLMGNETNTMPGYSGVQVVADAFLKGFKGFDTALAWQAVKATAMLDERGLAQLKRYGFIPADSVVESVSLGLEYAIADAGIAAMAKSMGKTADYNYFNERGKYYRNYFDTTAGFVRGRLSEKEWRTPFSPFKIRHMKDDFAEGNAWQYTWLAPQDVEGLIQLIGGPSAFVSKLDQLFTIKGDMGKEASDDITGLIGQYAHGNEPSHHITYLYTYAGQPWKTAEKVRYILDSLYFNKPDGLCGNEDVGQMSAWYVLSALGFYQVNPSGGVFVLGSPVMDKATLKWDNGNVLKITMINNSAANRYIQSVKLNGRRYSKTWFSYANLMKGGNIVIQMGDKPSATWGIPPDTWPHSKER